MKPDLTRLMFEKDFDEKHYRELTRLVQNYENNSSGILDEHLLEQIIDFYEDNNEFEKALNASDDAINQYPFSSVFMVKKAQLFFDLKQFDQALDLLDKAMVLDCRDMQIYLLQSDIQVWLGHYQKAIDAILHAIQMIEDKEELPDLYLELADIYEEWEKYDKVFEALTATLHYEPENEEALNRLWFCVELSELFQQSIDFHKGFIEENPYSFLAWFNLAHAYVGIGKYEEAVDAFEFVMAINEKYEYAYKDCADVLMLMENYDKAIEYYTEALKLSKPYKEIYIKLGECFEINEDFQKARYYYRKATNIDPYFDLAYNKIAHTYIKENRPQIAIPLFEKSCQLLPNNSIYLADLANAYKEAEDFELADEYFEKAKLAEKEVPTDVWMKWVSSKIASGDYTHALSIIEEASGFLPDESQVDFETARFIVLYINGKKQEAILLLEDLLESESFNLKLAMSLYPLLIEDNHLVSLIEELS